MIPQVLLFSFIFGLYNPDFLKVLWSCSNKLMQKITSIYKINYLKVFFTNCALKS